MRTRARLPLIVALVSLALLLLSFAGATAASFPLWMRYRSAAGLGPARTIAQIAAGLAAAGFFAAAAVIALSAALQPAGRWRKLLYVLPAELLVFTLIGVLLFIFRIGTVGVFTTVWLAAGGLLSIVAVLIATIGLPLDRQTVRRAGAALGFSGAMGGLAWLGLVASLLIVLTSPPSAAPGGPGSPPGAPSAPTAAAQAAPGAEGGEERQQPQGGPGRRAPSTTPLLLGVAIMAIFGAITWASLARVGRAARAMAAAPMPAELRHQAGRAVFSAVATGIVALALAQLVPVTRDNPPAQMAVQWDTPQTQRLASRACMDCHSNETTWPWYAYVAPGSWLLRDHVSGARRQFNLSELNELPAFRASQLPEQVGQEIRSGAMPPADYLIMHPQARLSNAEKQQLIQGLQQSLSTSLAK